MKGLVIFANYFEDVEAIAPVDILRRAKIDVTCAYIDNNTIISSHGNTLLFDTNLKDVNYKEYDFVILPGGKATFLTLRENKLVEEIVKYFYNNNKLLCAICAAPSVIGKHGYFDGYEYACYPNCNEIVTKGTLSDKPVVVTDRFITARSMYYSCDFGLAIVEKLKGKEFKDALEKQVKGL